MFLFIKSHRVRIILTALSLYLFITGITFAMANRLNSTPTTPTNTSNNTPIPTPTLPPPPTDQQPINIVIIGHGGAGHAGGNLADSIILLHLDTTSQKKALISIPRDLWILLQDSSTSQSHYKINTAFALSLDSLNQDIDEAKTNIDPGNTNLIKQAVSTVTDLPTHFVIAINFNNFESAIDTIGPLTVEVPHPINDSFYPVKGRELELCGFTPEEVTQMTATMSGFTLEKQFKCRYEQVKYEAGPATMDGHQALKFARSRHSSINGGDFNRSIRQQAVLKAIQSQLFSLEAIPNASEFFASLKSSVTTDINNNQAIQIAAALLKLKDTPLNQIYLNTQNVFTNSTSSRGAFIVIPKTGLNNWSQTHTYIQSQLTSNN